MKKSIGIFVLTNLVVFLAIFFYWNDGIHPILNKRNGLLPFIFLVSTVLLMTSLVVDLFLKQGLSIFFFLKFQILGYFLRNDVLWPSFLIWNINYFTIIIILLAFFILVFIVFYKVFTSENLFTKHRKGKEKMNWSWKKDSLFSKIFSVATLGIMLFCLTYVPLRTILMMGYLFAQEDLIINTKIIVTGADQGLSGKGSGYYHRFWKVNVHGKSEKFWVFAATSSDAKNCAWDDPEVGSLIKIKAKKGFLGTAIIDVLEIKNPDGKIRCE